MKPSAPDGTESSALLRDRRRSIAATILVLTTVAAFAGGCSSASAEVNAPPAEAESAEPAAAPSPIDRELLAAVSELRGLAGWTLIPLAHFRRGNVHGVVIWPAIDASGRLVDATVVGLRLVQGDDGAYEESGRRWVVRERDVARAAMAEALGGGDFDVVDRQAGASLDELGDRLAMLAAAFAGAVDAGDQRAAVNAAVAFSRLLPLDRAAHEPSVARLLWMASEHGASLEHSETTREGDRARLTLRITRSGVTVRRLEAVAAPLEAGSDQWVVMEYELE